MTVGSFVQKIDRKYRWPTVVRSASDSSTHLGGHLRWHTVVRTRVMAEGVSEGWRAAWSQVIYAPG
jgi:hypothetical protein